MKSVFATGNCPCDFESIEDEEKVKACLIIILKMISKMNYISMKLKLKRNR